MHKLLFLTTDPGGAAVLRMLQRGANEKYRNRFVVDMVDIRSPESLLAFLGGGNADYKDIILGTSLDMKSEKAALENLCGPGVSLWLVLDEIYNVAGRLRLLGTSIDLVKGIIYLCGTPAHEMLGEQPRYFIDHPITDKSLVSDRMRDFSYHYDPEGPIVVVDERKKRFHISGLRSCDEQFFYDICKRLLPSEELMCRSHPNHIRAENYQEGGARAILGYSSQFLIYACWSDIPFYSIADAKEYSFALSYSRGISRSTAHLIEQEIKATQLCCERTSQRADLETNAIEQFFEILG